MSNQGETEYEKKFQDDLAKAKALSLEQQALDEYRRTKKYGTTNYSTSASSASSFYERTAQCLSTNDRYSSSSYYSQSQRQRPSIIKTSRSTSSTEATPPQIAVPPPASYRRHSDIVVSSDQQAVTTPPPSKTPPPPENDLISFSSPTTKIPEHSTFERLIEDLQKMQNISKNSLVPLGPTAAASSINMYRPSVGPIAAPSAAMYTSQFRHRLPPPAAVPGAANMQIVPFSPPQKVPLTQEELQKLYSMPQQQHGAVPYALSHTHVGMGFVAPSMPYQAYPKNTAIVGGVSSAAYMQPPYSTSYGFHYVAPHPAAAGTGGGYYHQSSTTTQAGPNQLPKSESTLTLNSMNVPVSASSSRGQPPPVRKRGGDDLIDLNLEDDSRVSVLEAFDPLHQGDDDCVWKNNQYTKNVAN